MDMQSSGGTYESDTVIPFAPGAKNADDADQLDEAGQTNLKLLHKAAGWPKPTANMRSIWRRSFRISFEQPKIELRS
jgi:hypothetical protein